MKLPRRNTSGRGAQVRAGPMSMTDTDGEGVDTVTVGVTQTQDGPLNPTRPDGTEVSWQPDNGLQTGCRTWQMQLASQAFLPQISDLWIIFRAHHD